MEVGQHMSLVICHYISIYHCMLRFRNYLAEQRVSLCLHVTACWLHASCMSAIVPTTCQRHARYASTGCQHCQLCITTDYMFSHVECISTVLACHCISLLFTNHLDTKIIMTLIILVISVIIILVSRWYPVSGTLSLLLCKRLHSDSVPVT